MSLLSVTVKKARYVGIQATPQFNSYVTLKLQNVKSTTVTVKGPNPSWEQDFLLWCNQFFESRAQNEKVQDAANSEINDINLGLLVEVWNKGVIWDRALGYHYLPLTSVAYDEECGGRWVELEAQLMMRGGAVVGTTGPTGHTLLLDCRFEPPFDAEGTGGADLQRKLDLLNGALDAERAEQARRQMQYIAHSGYSEDSDYTSDLNYPVGQHPNCSASQFRTAAHQMHTPQRSLEASRENSYERDEYHIHGDADPLYYNSQPRTNRIDTWSQLHAQASVESAVSWRTAADWNSTEDQRRPSLERQNTLYDESMAFGYEAYTASTHIRDHSQISQQASYEEYFDSTSYPYQTSYVGDEARQWDSGGIHFYDDGYGLTPTEYENIVNKRRSSVVQLPQPPHSNKQLPFSSRYSEYNEMAPYRPRARRVTASLPATPSSTPKRGRALPVPPGSESGSIRSGKGRRLPRPPPNATPAPITQIHVPYVSEPEKTIADISYGYDSFGFQKDYQTTATDQYQDTNYNTHYDEDGMQPFFDETPHATPPAQKPTWSETENGLFSYNSASEADNLVPKSVPSTIPSYLPQVSVTTQQDNFETSYQQYVQYEDKYQYDQQEHQYPDISFTNQQFHEQEPNQQQSYEYQYQEEQKQHQQFQQQTYQQDQYLLQQQQLQQPQQQFQQHQLDLNQQQQQQQQQLYQQQQQQKQPVQQIQTTMFTGAATLGSLMAGGAKKLGSFFGAAAAAVAPPAISQATPATTASISHYSSTIAPVTPFSSTIAVPVTSVPEVSPSVPVTSVPVSTTDKLPRTPSLRRQESIQRPPVRRTRTLPEAPDDMPPSSYDSAYEDDYNKTETDQLIERDRTSLDRYHDEEYLHDTIPEEAPEDSLLHGEMSPNLQKTSPTRTVTQVRKPSVDSYHSQAPSITIDRKPSQTSFHLEEHVPTTQEESMADKSKVTFQVDRTTYHEVPEEGDAFQETEGYDEDGNEYRDQTYDQAKESEKFETDEQFQEGEDQYRDEQYQENDERHELVKLDFKPEQPKLTPKQRWHRAYNKIVMQMNVSDFPFMMVKAG